MEEGVGRNTFKFEVLQNCDVHISTNNTWLITIDPQDQPTVTADSDHYIHICRTPVRLSKFRETKQIES